MSPTDIVKDYYAAFDAHDFAKARGLMADDFHFVGPTMEAHSAKELFEKMQGFDCRFENRILHIGENGSTVGVLFDCTFSQPFEATVRMSEWFTVKDGKLASSNLVYDTKQMTQPAA